MRAALALLGCILATTLGALSLDFVGADRISRMKPWLVASVAGLLLHALTHASSHTPVAQPVTKNRTTKIGDLIAGLLGLAVAIASLERDGWVRAVPWSLRIVFGLVLAAGVSFAVLFPRKVAAHPTRSAEQDPPVG